MDDRIVTVAALAFHGDKVLLVKHGVTAQHLTGVYGLPGGRLNDGESLENGAIREFHEETGLTPDKKSIVKLKTIYQADIPRKSGKILKTFWHVFLIKNFSGSLKESDETIPEWVEIDKIKQFELLPNTKNAIQEGLKIS